MRSGRSWAGYLVVDQYMWVRSSSSRSDYYTKKVRSGKGRENKRGGKYLHVQMM
jgi:hypothetical protein